MEPAKTRFRQTAYYLRNLCMHDVQRKSVKITITKSTADVYTNGDHFFLFGYVSKRGTYKAFGVTPAVSRKNLRIKEHYEN